jgi:hypothetical protein
MSGSARGSDLGTWSSNRAALRKEAADAIAQLRDSQRQLTAAAGNTPAAAAVSLPDPSAAGVASGARRILESIAQKQRELGGLSAARTAAQSELAATQVQIELESARRGKEKARQEAERTLRSRKAAGWVTQKICRLAAVGVVVLMLYILAVY